MTNNESTIEVLNDLIQINNDRIEGYDNAIENLKDGAIAAAVVRGCSGVVMSVGKTQSRSEALRINVRGGPSQRRKVGWCRCCLHRA